MIPIKDWYYSVQLNRSWEEIHQEKKNIQQWTFKFSW